MVGFKLSETLYYPDGSIEWQILWDRPEGTNILLSKIETTYDTDGSVIEIIHYDENDSYYTTCKITYDPDGTESIEYHHNYTEC